MNIIVKPSKSEVCFKDSTEQTVIFEFFDNGTKFEFAMNWVEALRLSNILDVMLADKEEQ